jgi:hypothetical protein
MKGKIMKKGAFLLSFLLLTAVQAQDLPIYTCVKTATPPIIDGRGDDPVWRQAEPMHLVDVRDLSGVQRHTRPTEVRMLWDDEHLYVLFVATDPDVWSTLTERDDPLWDEEVVEIFIDPTGDSRNYVEIEVNPLNTIVDLLVSRPFRDGGRSYFEWSPEYETAVHVEGTVNDHTVEDEYWSMEIALPWTALETDLLDVMGDQPLPPRPGDQWRFNFYRYERIRENGRQTHIEYSAWSPVGEVNFHRPDRFGIVVFALGSTAVEESSWGQVKSQR